MEDKDFEDYQEIRKEIERLAGLSGETELTILEMLREDFEG